MLFCYKIWTLYIMHSTFKHLLGTLFLVVIITLLENQYIYSVLFCWSIFHTVSSSLINNATVHAGEKGLERREIAARGEVHVGYS